MLKIEMTIWDNSTSVAEKNDVLRYCENAALRVFRNSYNGEPQVKCTERTWGSITMEISCPFEDSWSFARAYNHLLNKYHYWRRDDEPLQMELDVK